MTTDIRYADSQIHGRRNLARVPVDVPADTTVPFQVSWLVNRIHAGTNELAVLREIRDRIRANHGTGAPRDAVRGYYLAALAQHRRNQAEWLKYS